MNKPPRESYILTLTDCGRPADGEPIRRLRALLKRALRSYAFRCTSVFAADQPPADQQCQPPKEPTT